MKGCALVLCHTLFWFIRGKRRAGVEESGHADSTWSCVKKLQTRRSACPRVCCITRSAFEATSTRAPSTTMAKSSSPFTKSLKPTVVRPAVRVRSSLGVKLIGGSGPCPSATGLAIPRVECRTCGLVRQVNVSFADPRRSYTKAFERYALELSRSMTIRDVARHLNVSWDLIKDIQKRDLSRRYAKPKLKHLRHIAIDEIAVAKGHRYLTVVMDLESGAVVFVGDGKGADALKPFWKRFAAQQGQDRGSGHGHVGGVLGSGHDPPAQGKDRLRPLPCDQTLQRQALRPPPSIIPRGDRRHAEGSTQGDAMAVAEEPCPSGEPHL